MVVVGNKYEFAFRHRTDPNYWKKPAFTLITFYIAILLLFSFQALVLVSFVTMAYCLITFKSLCNCGWEMQCGRQIIKFVIKVIIMSYNTGPSEKYSVSRAAQHAALHKAYKPTVSITHVCPSISNLPL